MLLRAFSSTVTVGKEPRQRIWEAIRELSESFTPHDLARRSTQMPQEIQSYLKALSLAKVIEVRESHRKPTQVTWRLVKDEGVDHPRLNTKGQRTTTHLAYENIWRTLRILGGELTFADLYAAVCVGSVSISTLKARQYLNALAVAGYLVRTQLPRNGGPDTYRLVPSRYTGPKPPIIHEIQALQVFDPNLGRIVFAKETSQQSEPYEDVWVKRDVERLQALLTEWANKDWSANSEITDLLQRTRLELAPAPGTGTVQ